MVLSCQSGGIRHRLDARSLTSLRAAAMRHLTIRVSVFAAARLGRKCLTSYTQSFGASHGATLAVETYRVACVVTVTEKY